MNADCKFDIERVEFIKQKYTITSLSGPRNHDEGHNAMCELVKCSEHISDQIYIQKVPS